MNQFDNLYLHPTKGWQPQCRRCGKKDNEVGLCLLQSPTGLKLPNGLKIPSRCACCPDCATNNCGIKSDLLDAIGKGEINSLAEVQNRWIQDASLLGDLTPDADCETVDVDDLDALFAKIDEVLYEVD